METIKRLYREVGDGKSVDIVNAVMNNDCCYVIKYFEDDKDINIVDSKNENLLHKAARNNHYEIVDLLIKFGVNKNAKNKYGDTPLHLAVQFKNFDIVEKLVFEKATINIQNNKMVAPLHLAASIGKEESLNILLDHGARLNISDENGSKPIHYAVKSGKSEIIRSLLSSGASLVECDDRKNNVLHYACETGQDDLVIFLLRHMVVIGSRNMYEQTPLHLAAINCKVKGIKALIQSGYDLDIKDINGFTPIDLAKINNRAENYSFMQEFHRSEEYKKKFLDFPLHRAAAQKNHQFILQKINSNNVNQYDFFGKSLMYYAIIAGSLKTIEVLYKKGARIDDIDEYNHSALLTAIYGENHSIVKFLLEHKADVNEIFYGRSYLYRSILRNNYEITKLLIEYGADVNYIDNRHRTIYSYAIEIAGDDIINLLSDNKASLL